MLHWTSLPLFQYVLSPLFFILVLQDMRRDMYHICVVPIFKGHIWSSN